MTLQLISSSQHAGSGPAIVTHAGPFHCDEVGAVAALLWIRGHQTRVCRTRDRDDLLVWAKRPNTTMVDVGGAYAPDATMGAVQLDHHQKGGAGQRPNGVPFSSFGLVWQVYGLRIVEAILDEAGIWGVDHKAVAQAIDEALVQAVDSGDTQCAETNSTVRATSQKISWYGISLAVHQLNPPAVPGQKLGSFDVAFVKAVEWFDVVLYGAVTSAAAEWLAMEAVRGAAKEQPGPVLVLGDYVDWLATVCREFPEILFVVFKNPENTWMVQQVPVTLGSPKGRKALPAAWSAMRDEEFQKATGVSDAVFCHLACFIAGAKSREGAMLLAKLAVEA